MELDSGITYLTETKEKRKKKKEFLGGNNQILELVYLHGTKILTKFDFGNCSGYQT